MFRNRLAVVFFLLAALMSAAGPAGAEAKDTSGKLSIAVIPERADLDFWKLLRKGAESAVFEDGNIKMLWIIPTGLGSFKAQQRKIEWCIENKVDAIVISPVHQRRMRDPLKKALRKGIPVIQMVSRALKGSGTGYIHSDNFAGGVLAARYLDEKLNGSGKVVLGMFKRGNSPVNQRIMGFKKQLKDSGSKIRIAKSIYVGGHPERGSSKVRVAMWSSGSDNLETPDIKAVLGMNESSSEILIETLGELDRLKGLTFVAFNPDPDMVRGIQDGKISAGVAQDPYKIGRLAVTQAAMAVRGGKAPSETVTEVYLVTGENLAQPKIQEILGLKKRSFNSTALETSAAN